MLANNLTVEGEEAVQAELKELEREAVRLTQYLVIIIFDMFICSQLGEDQLSELPSVPTKKPTEDDREGKVKSLIQIIANFVVAEEVTPIEENRERIPVAA